MQKEGVSFGGDVTTATDIAMATGLLAPFGTAKLPQTIGCQTAYAASMHIYKMIGDTIDAIKVMYVFVWDGIVCCVVIIFSTICSTSCILVLSVMLFHGFTDVIEI